MKSSDKSNSFEEVSPLFLIAKKFSVYTNSNFLFPISLQPDSVNLWYYKLRLFDLTECIVWNNWDLFIQLQGIGKSEFVAKTQFLCRNLLELI